MIVEIACPHCSATGRLEEDVVPALPDALAFDCATCALAFVVWRGKDGLRTVAMTRTGQAQA